MVQLFQIFDRWGQRIYERRDVPANAAEFGWDGTYRGEAVNQGTYLWFAEVRFPDGRVDVYRGQTNLIR